MELIGVLIQLNADWNGFIDKSFYTDESDFPTVVVVSPVDPVKEIRWTQIKTSSNGATDGSITVSWRGNPLATKYEAILMKTDVVYVSTKEVTDTSVTFSSITNTNYNFKMRVHDGTAWLEYQQLNGLYVNYNSGW